MFCTEAKKLNPFLGTGKYIPYSYPTLSNFYYEYSLCTRIPPSPLHSSILSPSPSLHEIQSLIAQGADVNARDNFKRTPLFHAYNNPEITRILLENGAKVEDVFDFDHYSIMEVAVRGGNIEVMKLLLSTGVHVDYGSRRDGLTVFYVAAFNNQVEMMRFLKERGANVDFDKRGRNYTPLMVAAQRGNLEIVKELIKLGADVNRIGHAGATPLRCAVLSNELDCVIALIEAGAKLESTPYNSITSAILKGHDQIARYLLDQVAGFSAKSIAHTVLYLETQSMDYPLFHSAAMFGNATILRFLKATREVDVNEEVAGCTPAYLATLNNSNIDALEALIEMGADINLNSPFPVLHTTMVYQMEETFNPSNIERIVKLGGKVDMLRINTRPQYHAYDRLRYGDDFSPLQTALLENKLKFVKALINAGASLTVKKESGHMAIHCCESGEALQMMLDAGASIDVGDPLFETFIHRCSALPLLNNVLKKILELGLADPDTRNSAGETPLFTKILPNFCALLDAGASMYIVDNSGQNILHFTAAYEDLFKELKFRNMDFGVLAHGKNDAGETALHKAATYGDPETVEELIKSGFDVNAQDSGSTPLFYCSDRTFPVLLKHGADLQHVSQDGRTVLHHIAVNTDTGAQRYISVVKMMVKAGVRTDVTDKDGKTPMELMIPSWQRYDYQERVFGDYVELAALLLGINYFLLFFICF